MFPGPGERGRSIKDWAKIILPWQFYCYKLVQSFRVHYLFTGQFNTKGYGHVLYISTSVWVLRTPNAGRNDHFQRFYITFLHLRAV